MATQDSASKFAKLRSGWQPATDMDRQWAAQQSAHAKSVASLATGITDAPGDWDPDHLAAVRDAAIALAAAAVAALSAGDH